MKPKIYLLALGALLIAVLSPSAVLADQVFTVTGTYTDGSTMAGTLTINTVSGVVDAADLSWSEPGLGNIFTSIAGQGTLDGNAFVLVSNSLGDDGLDLYLAAPSWIGFMGGPICGTESGGFPVCGGGSSAIANPPRGPLFLRI